MKNPQYTRLLQRAARKMNEARGLVEKAEAEYERRYGSHPSDANDDMWIDSMTGSNGRCNEDITADDIERSATEYAGLPPSLPNNSGETQPPKNRPTLIMENPTQENQNALASGTAKAVVCSGGLGSVSGNWGPLVTPEEDARLTHQMKHGPCFECGASSPEDADKKCKCAGDKDHCHGCDIWPDA